MDPMETVLAWDRALRDSDWTAARSLLADDATYTAESISCSTPDEIVGLMRSWKGKVPDVEVVEWQALGDHVLAWLRQPAFGPDAEWFQVLSVREGRIAKLRDYQTRDEAVEAAERSP